MLIFATVQYLNLPNPQLHPTDLTMHLSVQFHLPKKTVENAIQIEQTDRAVVFKIFCLERLRQISRSNFDNDYKVSFAVLHACLDWIDWNLEIKKKSSFNK